MRPEGRTRTDNHIEVNEVTLIYGTLDADGFGARRLDSIVLENPINKAKGEG